MGANKMGAKRGGVWTGHACSPSCPLQSWQHEMPGFELLCGKTVAADRTSNEEQVCEQGVAAPPQDDPSQRGLEAGVVDRRAVHEKVKHHGYRIVGVLPPNGE